MFKNYSKPFLISASLLSIFAVSFSDIAVAMDDKGKEEATDDKARKPQLRKENRNINSQKPAEPFQFEPHQMQEVVKEDVFASLRGLKAPQICKPFKENLPKSEQDSLRAKKLLHSLKWQCEISRELCSNLRRQTELSKLESLQADEEFALRLNKEEAVDPFKGEGFGYYSAGFSDSNFEGFKSSQPTALEFVPLEFDSASPIAHSQDDDDTVEMMEFEEKVGSNSFNGEGFKFEGFPPETGIVPFEFGSNTFNFQFPQFEGNYVPLAPSLREAAQVLLQIPLVFDTFDPNNLIERPSAPSFWDLPYDAQLLYPEYTFNPLYNPQISEGPFARFISELPLAQDSDNLFNNGRGSRRASTRGGTRGGRR